MPSPERFEYSPSAVSRGELELPPSSTLTESLNRLEQAVAEIHDSETFRRYLTAQARFHQYSWGNVLLILAQKPDASKVAGYRAWQSLGRQVRRGEQGIRILVPMRQRIIPEPEDEDNGQQSQLFFGTGSVFDISQTEGPPLPEVAVPILEGDTGHDLYGQLEGLAHQERVSVQQAHQLQGGVMGYYDRRTRQVVVRQAAAQQMTKTLAHELAHHFSGASSSTPEEESIAESVAYVVCARFGLDTGERSFPYVAVWSRQPKTLKGVLTRVQTISSLMIDRLDAALSDNSTRKD